MFDPFGDHETAGYLRNSQQEKALDIVKAAEHALFRAQLPEALAYLARRARIESEDFLEVHRLLFSALYRGPVWTVLKFCLKRPRRAVEDGLTRAQERGQISTRPGLIMGLFAYGHPFLDGNGRAMLLVHAGLCFRAGISVGWTRTQKDPYLRALTLEIEAPNDGHLDAYLAPFISAAVPRDQWQASVARMPGLDGVGTQADAAATYADPLIAEGYAEFERRRDYRLR